MPNPFAPPIVLDLDSTKSLAGSDPSPFHAASFGLSLSADPAAGSQGSAVQSAGCQRVRLRSQHRRSLANALISSTVSLVCKMLRGPVGHGAFPPDEQLEVVTLATSKTSEHDCVASQWSLDDLAADLVNRHADEAMTRSTIWRILNAADLKPHRSVYWLNSHDPDFDAKAQDICKLYVQAPVLYQHGELVICTRRKDRHANPPAKTSHDSGRNRANPKNANTNTSATAPAA